MMNIGFLQRRMNWFKRAIHTGVPVVKRVANAIWRGLKPGIVAGFGSAFEMFIWIGCAVLGHLALKHWGGVHIHVFHFAVLTALGQLLYYTKKKHAP